jgi:hypothetical protein
MRFGDLHHDRQSQSSAASSSALTAPETIENALLVIRRYTRPVV